MIKLKKDSLKFNGFYRGKVLDNADPDNLGRIKIEIFGVFDDIDASSLPWAVPAFPLFVGSGSGFGNFAVPEVNSHVWAFFEGGDYNQPVYFAEAADAVRGIPSEALTNYPDRRVMKTKNGIVIYIDDSSKEIKIDHPEGAYILIDETGNVKIKGTTVHINP